MTRAGGLKLRIKKELSVCIRLLIALQILSYLLPLSAFLGMQTKPAFLSGFSHTLQMSNP